MAKTAQPFTELPLDDRGQPIQIGKEFTTQDASGTVQPSPLSYTTGQAVITIPDRAVEFIVAPTTDLRVSEVAGMARYDIVQAGTKEVFPCAFMESIFIKANATAGTLRFRFTLI